MPLQARAGRLLARCHAALGEHALSASALETPAELGEPEECTVDWAENYARLKGCNEADRNDARRPFLNLGSTDLPHHYGKLM